MDWLIVTPSGSTSRIGTWPNGYFPPKKVQIIIMLITKLKNAVCLSTLVISFCSRKWEKCLHKLQTVDSITSGLIKEIGRYQCGNWQSDPTLRHKQPSYMWVMCGLYAENVCQQDNVRGKNKFVEWKAFVEHNYDQKEQSDTAINLVACEYSRYPLLLAAKAKRHWRRGARKNGCIAGYDL